MKYKVISFDLQGTLSNSAFSDEFWLETLPQLYAKQKNVPIERAKQELKGIFKAWGKYDYRYYSLNYWLKELKCSLSFQEILRLMINKPHFFSDVELLLKRLKGKAKLIVVSTTTKEFIGAELGKQKGCFDFVFSSLDDFQIAGKPKEVYEQIALQLEVEGSDILHIGDDREMDIKNAQKAGWHTFFFDKEKQRREVLDALSKVL